MSITPKEQNKVDDEEDDEDDDVENEKYKDGQYTEHTKIDTAALQTMKHLAIHFPPKKLIPFCLALVEPALQGGDQFRKECALAQRPHMEHHLHITKFFCHFRLSC